VAAVASPACKVPTRTPGGKPVTEVPGLRPRSPVTVVRLALVTVEPARMAKIEAEPRSMSASLQAAVVISQTWSTPIGVPTRSSTVALIVTV
jgi:hypothetical protein